MLFFMNIRSHRCRWKAVFISLICGTGILLGMYGYWSDLFSLTQERVEEPIKDLTELCEWLSQDDVPHIGKGLVTHTAAKLEAVECFQRTSFK